MKKWTGKGGRFYDETEDTVRVKRKENEVTMVRLAKSYTPDEKYLDHWKF